MAENNYIEGKQGRNSNIEILRVILMLFICLWHIIMHGFNFKEIGADGYVLELDRAIVTFFCALFAPAVYCFMFISGWYGIKFSKKKFCYFAYIGFSCYFISILIRAYFGCPIKITSVFKHILPIASNNWWFLTSYIMVFLIAPFIDLSFKMLKTQNIKQIIYLLTYIEVMGFFTLDPYGGYSFFGLLYMYILARYLRTNQIVFSRNKIIPLYYASLLALWLACYWASGLKGENARLSFIFLGYSNPLIIIMAISIFYFVNSIKPVFSKLVNLLFSNTLIIYLLTEGVGVLLYKYEADLMKENALYGILFVVFTMIVSLTIGLMLSSAYNVVNNFIVKGHEREKK